MVCVEAMIYVSLVLKMTLKKAHKEKEDNFRKHNLAENNFSLKFPSQQDNKLTSVWIHLVPSHSSFSIQQVLLWMI